MCINIFPDYVLDNTVITEVVATNCYHCRTTQYGRLHQTINRQVATGLATMIGESANHVTTPVSTSGNAKVFLRIFIFIFYPYYIYKNIYILELSSD